MQPCVKMLYLIRILPVVQLSFSLAHDSVSLRQAIRSLHRIRVVRWDFGPLREEVITSVIQPVVCVGADHVGGAAVGVVSSVSLLAI